MGRPGRNKTTLEKCFKTSTINRFCHRNHSPVSETHTAIEKNIWQNHNFHHSKLIYRLSTMVVWWILVRFHDLTIGSPYQTTGFHHGCGVTRGVTRGLAMLIFTWTSMVDSGRSFSTALQTNNFSGTQVRVLEPWQQGGCSMAFIIVHAMEKCSCWTVHDHNSWVGARMFFFTMPWWHSCLLRDVFLFCACEAAKPLLMNKFFHVVLAGWYFSGVILLRLLCFCFRSCWCGVCCCFLLLFLVVLVVVVVVTVVVVVVVVVIIVVVVVTVVVVRCCSYCWQWLARLAGATHRKWWPPDVLKQWVVKRCCSEWFPGMMIGCFRHHRISSVKNSGWWKDQFQ